MGSFLQSKEWAKFQESLNRKTWRIDDILVIRHNLPLNKNYLYAPRCEGKFLSEDFLEGIKEIAKKEGSIFFKVEPASVPTKSVLWRGKFKKSQNIQPDKTLILDIKKSEEELLRQMHYKTRYNIRLAEKKGIEIRRGKTKEDFEKFWKLLEQAIKRNKFRPHPKEYYKKMLKVLPGAELFVAEYQGKIIAVNIVLFWSKTATYLHGASDYQYRNLMAPHLLQWQQILEAKKRGYTEYDFWGIDEKKWPGVTRFKRGFGGKEISYPGACDLVFRALWYRIYKLVKKFK